uniref:Uncharacterized protein n=1 Tax=Glossina brevipalpis TaxID=37001 RepID=A0A1A9WXG6_9MUSC
MMEVAMTIINYLKQASTTAPGVLGIGIIATLTVTLCYRKLLKPEMDRRRREEAEAVADYLFQKDPKRNTNVSL